MLPAVEEITRHTEETERMWQEEIMGWNKSQVYPESLRDKVVPCPPLALT